MSDSESLGICERLEALFRIWSTEGIEGSGVVFKLIGEEEVRRSGWSDDLKPKLGEEEIADV